MMRPNQKNRRGFTLIEILLYVTLTAIMVTILGGVGVNVIESRAKIRALGEVDYNARFVFEKIVAIIQAAESVNAPTDNATSTTLSLSISDPTRDPTVITTVDGAVSVTEGSKPAVTISTNGVVITDLFFRDVSYPNTPSMVRVSMTVSSYNPEERKTYEITEAFYATVGMKTMP